MGPNSVNYTPLMSLKSCHSIFTASALTQTLTTLPSMNLILIFLPLYLSHSKPSATLEPKPSSKAHYHNPLLLLKFTSGFPAVEPELQFHRRACETPMIWSQTLSFPPSLFSDTSTFPMFQAGHVSCNPNTWPSSFLASSVSAVPRIWNQCPPTSGQPLHVLAWLSTGTVTSQKLSLGLFSLLYVKCPHRT